MTRKDVSDMGATAARYIVTPAGYDDIGAVLSGLGEGFQFDEVTLDDIDQDRLKKCTVLFLNCSAEASECADDIANVIREYVKSGGSVYASDWAADILSHAFPEIITFDCDGQAGDHTCQVCDPGLQESIGKTISIHFDLGAWRQVSKIHRDVRVYVKGDATLEKRPIVCGFAFGKGHVIYTSFHNEHQLSAEEKKLLKYLVLRPVLANSAASAGLAIQAQQCTPGKEILATVDRGKIATYAYDAKAGEGLLFVLHWTGAGHLRLKVTDPSGNPCQAVDGKTPPLKIDIPAASSGKWLFTVEVVNIPYNNFPYVLTVATKKATTTSGKSSSVSSGPQREWPCYVLIDCSATASDVAPQIGQGVSEFLKGLRSISVPGVVPVLSFVECRQGINAINMPSRLDSLKPFSLACTGNPCINPALQGTYNHLTSTSGLKPLVVIALASDPIDDFSLIADKYQQLVFQGKLNVMVVGIGQDVSLATLKKLGNIALRIDNPYGAGSAVCFAWLAKTAGSIMMALSGSYSSAPLALPSLPSGVTWVQ